MTETTIHLKVPEHFNQHGKSSTEKSTERVLSKVRKHKNYSDLAHKMHIQCTLPHQSYMHTNSPVLRS